MDVRWVLDQWCAHSSIPIHTRRYIDTPNAQQGDIGSKVLPAMPTGVVWARGETVEAKWSIRANHGGGYQYVQRAPAVALAVYCPA